MKDNNLLHDSSAPGVPAEDKQMMIDALAKALVQAANDQQEKPAAEGKPEKRTIDFTEMFYVLLSKIHFVIIAALVGAIFLGITSAKSVPMYSATSKLYISGGQGTSLNLSDLQLGSMLTMDYEEVFRTWEVHEMVRSQLDLDYSYSQLQSMISISNPDDTRVLYITVRNPDAQLAADIANAYAKAAKTFILQTMDSEEPNVFSVALVPTTAQRVNKSVQVLKGLIAGGMLAVGVIVALFVVDDRPRTPQHIQQVSGVPMLAVVPAVKKEHLKNIKRGQKRALS